MGDSINVVTDRFFFVGGLLRIWWILYGSVIYWIKHGEEREVWNRKG